MADVWVFVFSMVDGISLLFLSVYFIVTLSDLECDYINARSCCTKLNRLVLPEIIGQSALSVLLLLSWHWMLGLLSLPLTCWQIYRFVQKPSGNIGVYDPTEIHSRSLLKYYMKESMIKLGHHLIFFFLFLYNEIWYHHCGQPFILEQAMMLCTTGACLCVYKSQLKTILLDCSLVCQAGSTSEVS